LGPWYRLRGPGKADARILRVGVFPGPGGEFGALDDAPAKFPTRSGAYDQQVLLRADEKSYACLLRVITCPVSRLGASNPSPTAVRPVLSETFPEK
jgi:hypothetical protein